MRAKWPPEGAAPDGAGRGAVLNASRSATHAIGWSPASETSGAPEGGSDHGGICFVNGGGGRAVSVESRAGRRGCGDGGSLQRRRCTLAKEGMGLRDGMCGAVVGYSGRCRAAQRQRRVRGVGSGGSVGALRGAGGVCGGGCWPWGRALGVRGISGRNVWGRQKQCGETSLGVGGHRRRGILHVLGSQWASKKFALCRCLKVVRLDDFCQWKVWAVPSGDVFWFTYTRVLTPRRGLR